jgi:hypothetical protein
LATIGYADLPVPGGGDGPAVPGSIAALAEALDPHLVQHVTNAADRTTTLADAPQHTLAIANDGTTWVKTDSGSDTWATLWTPVPAWQDVTPASGYEGGSYAPQARMLPTGQVFLRGRLQKVDGTVVPDNGIKIGSVPTAMIPQVQVGSFAGQDSLQDDVQIGVGKVEVLEATTSSSLGVPGDIIWWSQDGPTAGGTPWVNISGSYWID